MANQTHSPLPIDFISVDDEPPDLIISFVIKDTVGSDSVTLMRTPEFEVFEDAAEKGLRVYRNYDTDPTSIVSRIAIHGHVISIEGSNSAYRLDVSNVEHAELKDILPIIAKMNFDGQFDLII